MLGHSAWPEVCNFTFYFLLNLSECHPNLVNYYAPTCLTPFVYLLPAKLAPLTSLLWKKLSVRISPTYSTEKTEKNWASLPQASHPGVPLSHLLLLWYHGFPSWLSAFDVFKELFVIRSSILSKAFFRLFFLCFRILFTFNQSVMNVCAAFKCQTFTCYTLLNFPLVIQFPVELLFCLSLSCSQTAFFHLYSYNSSSL